jgi:hypothetical protein
VIDKEVITPSSRELFHFVICEHDTRQMRTSSRWNRTVHVKDSHTRVMLSTQQQSITAAEWIRFFADSTCSCLPSDLSPAVPECQLHSGVSFICLVSCTSQFSSRE